MPDPEPSRPDDSGALGGGTVRISRAPQGEAPDHTQRLALPGAEDPPLRAPGSSVSAGTAGRTLTPAPGPRPSRRARGWLLPALLAGLALAGGSAYAFFTRRKAPDPLPQAATAAPEAVPPGAMIYLEQAKAGDAHAMRMLGVMYYYGLNVPQDREKGLYWYRKAAAKGSEAARQELEKLEGKS